MLSLCCERCDPCDLRASYLRVLASAAALREVLSLCLVALMYCA